MNLKELKSNFKKTLSKFYPPEEIQSFFNILSEKYLKLSRIQITLNPETEVSEADSEKFQQVLYRLKNYEPIQYIMGETEFFGLLFKVNQHTLIPRPETEGLVEWILKETLPSKGVGAIFLNTELNVLDIGTGSGCIAIALSKNLSQAKVSALDISEDALKIAKENATLNKIDVNFFQADILKTKTLPQQYDVIVSNPPYVRELEKKQMQKNVLEYEPDSALFVSDENPLLFYKTISHLAKNHLKPNGKLFFEINEYLSKELSQLLKTDGFQNIDIKKDLFGKDRMVKSNL